MLTSYISGLRVCAPSRRLGVFVSRFRRIFPSVSKPLIAMVHVGALPGTPLYNRDAGMAGIVSDVRRDLDVLLDVGFDAVMFCNENDRPYQLQAGLEGAAALARVVAECKPDGIPFGVDFLWDARCALAVGATGGASFIREVLTGVWESDMGLWAPDAAYVLRERRRLDVDDLAIFMNVTPEFASSTGRRAAAQVAQSTAVSSLADAILVSGPMAGAVPDLATVAEIRESTSVDVPVLLNTGAKATTIADFLVHADGCIVGSDLKVDGYTWNPVDRDRAKRFIDAARAA